MKKLKTLNGSSILAIIKSALWGLIITLIGVILLAVLLKFVDIKSSVVGIINNAIKVLSLFVSIMYIGKNCDGKLLFRALCVGFLYAILSFIIFSALNGSFDIDLSFTFDLLFALISSVIISIIVGVVGKKA